MATKVKPTRLQITGTPQVGKVPTYVDKDTFAWGAGGGGGASFGRFLSLWDCTTGQPISFPEATPYTYLTGDYYIVSVVSSATPPVNYRPNGSSYTGTASSVTESDEVEVGDTYVYDGATWLLQSNHGKTVTFANIAGQPTDNTNLANDLLAKQDVLTAGTNINISSNVISATDTTYSAGTGIGLTGTTFSNTGVLSVNSSTGTVSLDADDIPDATTTNKFVTDADKNNWDGKQDELVSGVNIRTINGTSILGNGDITTPTGIPSQTGEAGKFLTTDGTSVSWGTVSAGVTSVNGNTGAVTVSEFTPSNAGSADQVLTKTAGGYERAAAPASGIQNDTTGTTTTVTAIRCGTEAEYNALQSHSASVIYHIY